MKTNYGFGAFKSPEDKRDYIITPFLLGKEDFPSSDYLMSPVKSQGKRGSCVSYGTVAVKEYEEMVEHNLLPDTYIDLSEEHFYAEVRKEYWGKGWEEKEGADGRSAAKVLSTIGVCEERYWKYGKVQGETQPIDGYLKNAEKYKIKPSYVRVTKESEIPATLAEFGPMTISFYVYQNWIDVKEDGKIKNSSWWSFKPLGGHLVCVCGFNPKTNMYKIKNSWSTKWGNEGYGYISRKEVQKELMDAFAFVDIPDDTVVATLGGTIFRHERLA